MQRVRAGEITTARNGLCDGIFWPLVFRDRIICAGYDVVFNGFHRPAKRTHDVSQIIHAFCFLAAITIPNAVCLGCLQTQLFHKLRLVLPANGHCLGDSTTASVRIHSCIRSLRAALHLLLGYFGLICDPYDLRE